MSDMGQGEEAITAGEASKLRDVRSSLHIDSQQLNKLRADIDKLTTSVKALRKEFEGVAKAASGISSAIGGGGAGGGYSKTDTGATAPDSSGASTLASTAGMGGKLGTFAKAAAGVTAVSQVIAPVVSGIDNRIVRAESYASGVDRLNVLMQQMYGMSQNQVMAQRGQLTGYRLGPTGISDLMQFQTQLGVQATPELAQSLAGMRAASGYSVSTQQLLQQQRSLMNPAVANRMFYMTGGINAYNIGGGMRDPMQMQQQLVQLLGLNNEDMIQGSMQLGSVMRTRMADLGLDENLQTSLLQYARQNVQFRQRGGRGMYDPGSAADRRLMGIEDNFATEQEETGRLNVAREEQFLRRQLDNMATNERLQQAMVKSLTSIEDKVSGIYGFMVSSRGARGALGGIMKGFGYASIAAGVLAAPATGGASLSISAAGAALVAGGTAVSGDDDPGSGAGEQSVNRGMGSRSFYDSSNDHNIMVPLRYGGETTSLADLQRDPRFSQLDSHFKRNLTAMLRAANAEGVPLGVGDTKRYSSEQATAFFNRTYEVGANDDYDYQHGGRYYKLKSGQPPTLPPGRSLHEFGLAVDLVQGFGGNRNVPQGGWVAQNAARFGLTLPMPGREPWHIQPVNARNQRPGTVTDASGQSVSSNASSVSTGRKRTVGTRIALYRGSMSEILDARQGAGGMGLVNRGYVGSQSDVGGSVTRSSGNRGGRYGGRLTAEEVARLAYNAGFRGEDLVTAVAVAFGESSLNAGALNDNASTGDLSYGLMQINMLNSLGPARRNAWGLDDNDELFDPAVNMRAAFSLYSNRGNKFTDWSVYKNNAHVRHMGVARDAVSALNIPQTGDDMPSRGYGGGGGMTVHSSSPTINIAPVIHFNGSAGDADLRQIAKKVAKMMEEEVSALSRRGA